MESICIATCVMQLGSFGFKGRFGLGCSARGEVKFLHPY